MKENALQIEHGIKTEMAESFFNGLLKVFSWSTISVFLRRNSTCLMEWQVSFDDMEAKLNEQIDANVALNKRVGEFVKMEIVNECAVGLAETQKEKACFSRRGVEFETEEDFRKKVETIKESYFTSKAELTESVSEPTEEASEPLVEETVSGRCRSTSMLSLAGPNNCKQSTLTRSTIKW